MTEPTVTLERDGHVLLMGLNRAEKRNAFNMDMLRELSLAYGELDRDPDLRCGVLFAHGDHFTAGLDLIDVGPNINADGFPVPEGGIDFTGLYTDPVSKPVVVAVQGRCLTLGIEISLAADVRVAARDARFAQIEIKRGIMPFGGATIRFARDFGWGNAMRYLLTGDEFDAEEAFRIGLVQQLTEPGEQVEAALGIARTIAAQAPLGVQASLRNARLAWREGEAAAAARLFPELSALMGTEDAREGIQSFIERRDGNFSGR
jgi:enoyl-CoA hydratase/carnithine racemase